jgi:hypothetical protein
MKVNIKKSLQCIVGGVVCGVLTVCTMYLFYCVFNYNPMVAIVIATIECTCMVAVLIVIMLKISL